MSALLLKATGASTRTLSVAIGAASCGVLSGAPLTHPRNTNRGAQRKKRMRDLRSRSYQQTSRPPVLPLKSSPSVARIHGCADVGRQRIHVGLDDLLRLDDLLVL